MGQDLKGEPECMQINIFVVTDVEKIKIAIIILKFLTHMPAATTFLCHFYYVGVYQEPALFVTKNSKRESLTMNNEIIVCGSP